MFATLQWFIVVVLSVGAFIGAVWGVIDATRHTPGSFTSAGKLSKNAWVIILGISSLVAFISLPAPIGRGGGIVSFLGLPAVAAVVVYFVAVRPHLSGNRGRGTSTGGW